MKESIVDGGNDNECWECGAYGTEEHPLERHHLCHGTANRAQAEKYGLWVYLCYKCHRGTEGVHGKNGHQRDISLKRVGQRAFEAKIGSREEFRAIFGRSYIDED